MTLLFPVEKNTEQISKYKVHVDKVNFSRKEIPVKFKDIKNENINNIRFNVFGSDIYPCYI